MSWAVAELHQVSPSPSPASTPLEALAPRHRSWATVQTAAARPVPHQEGEKEPGLVQGVPRRLTGRKAGPKKKQL